eukprot:5277422-Heterocapsa_arctica.AAC.1
MDGAWEEVPVNLLEKVEQVDPGPSNRLHTSYQDAPDRNDPIGEKALPLQDSRSQVHDDDHVHDSWRISSSAANGGDSFRVHGIVELVDIPADLQCWDT